MPVKIRHKRRPEVHVKAMNMALFSGQQTVNPFALALERVSAMQALKKRKPISNEMMSDHEFNKRQLERGLPRLQNKRSEDYHARRTTAVRSHSS